ncbi:mechanosensitive ion channel family protein [Mucilaginibacter sp. BT774]|uniref:mechanosensitive ion channel family protein n=1 Tax=Mucilaginibacter sp. BT774 TaxID=3062276 RepID=UPI00267648A0|nr:mechanosensitive ion channel domain-containing protein [Mucilaginibacter sp. BT774]MDO3625480.1 mechanosensitive ion channel [Mucilaginibacter sp. BT774]
MRKIAKALLLIVVVITTLGIHNSLAQEKKKKPKSLRDTERKLKHSRDSVLQSLNKADTSIHSLLQHIEQYISTFNQINNDLADGLDTIDVSQKIPRTYRRLIKIQELANNKKSSTLRYLFVLRDNLDHIQGNLEDWQSSLDDVNSKLVQNQHDILKCAKDSLLHVVPQDSALRSAFFEKLGKLRELWRKTDSANRANLLAVNLLQNQVSVAYTTVLDETDQIDAKIKRFANRAMDGEFGFIWEKSPQYNDLGSALKATIDLNNTQLYYFIKNGTATHLIGLLLLIAITVWIFYNRQRTRKNSDQPDVILDHTNYIYTNPVSASLLIVTALVPYFYDHPPVSFLEIFFLISIIFILVLVKKGFPQSTFSFLVQLFGLTIIYALSNLLIQITVADRFVTLIISIAAIIIAWLFYKKIKKSAEGQLPYTRTVVIIFILLQFLSLLLNLAGRFSLSKILGITAVFNLWMLISLYFIIQILIQGIFLQFHSKTAENTFISWIDYSILQKKFRSTLSAFAALLWLFFLLQNLNIDDWVSDYLGDVLNQSRSIGGASFTFGGFVIFIIIIWMSTLLSKLISYFYDLSAQHTTDLSALKKKNRASTLLIRIGVFTVGFLLAVAASNFPIDKLTIIFSAFGVGIGFGLQNIVNNLVSGMILAFEKPVQIGDIIEVGSHAGTIKEIGIRSSKLATSDGSEVIIPNGDLISQQVTNWTLSNTNRRIEVMVVVAYGSDIEKVNKLLTDLLGNRDDIMSTPGPSVYVNNITDKFVEFRASFWAADISNAPELRSRILAAIYESFAKEGINLPTS